MTTQEAHSLLEAVQGQRNEALYHTALVLGLRMGELLGLRWADLDWNAANLKITQQAISVGGQTVLTTPKSLQSVRTLPVPPGLLQRLRSHWANLQQERLTLDTDWQEHGLIFPSTKGTPRGQRNLCREFYAARSRAELPKDINFHKLRHTAATMLGETSTNEATIGAILGHAGGSVTRRYTHATQSAMREALEKVEAVLLKQAA